jgi:opacity protein-like surface antigen
MKRTLATIAAAAAVLSTASAASAAIVISKVYFDPPGDDSRAGADLNAEWVEIRNTGNASVALAGWTLRDTDRHIYRFKEFTLRPGATVRVHTGGGRDGGRHLYQNTDNWIWNNDGDTATLRDRRGRNVDTCRYSGSGASVAC